MTTKDYKALAAQPREAGQARELPNAPPNSLPTWSECAMRVKNSDFIAKRVTEGGYGVGPDSLLASALHQFIYEYDDADPCRSAWFMHRLEQVLKEFAAAQAAPSVSADKDAGRLNWFDGQGYAYGFEDMHEGNAWEIKGPFRTVRDAIDAAIAAQSKDQS